MESVPANLQFAGAEYGDLQSLLMAVAFMATRSFTAANVAVFSEKQGENVFFPHHKCLIFKAGGLQIRQNLGNNAIINQLSQKQRINNKACYQWE